MSHALTMSCTRRIRDTRHGLLTNFECYFWYFNRCEHGN